MRRSKAAAWAKGGIVCLVLTSCSGGSSPTSPASPPPSPVSVTTPPAAPTPTPGPRYVEAGCTQGQGTVDASCGKDQSLLLADVNATIEQVIREHPGYFDLKQTRGEGSYKIVQRDAYTNAVIAGLGDRGLCAALNMYRDAFLVKRNDARSEQFEVEGPSDFIQRGPQSYDAACTPAAFPLEATAVVVKMWVGLYEYQCYPWFMPPVIGSTLPMACDGLITATPKDKSLRTVPMAAHGPDISWFVRNGEDRIELRDSDPALFNPFNKRLVPLAPGDFSVCATVLQVTGCFNGQVVP
jgi:hypothetical protein